MQVEAGNLTPVTALVQNMIMTALFEPFEALCSAANAEMSEVCLHPKYLEAKRICCDKSVFITDIFMTAISSVSSLD